MVGADEETDVMIANIIVGGGVVTREEDGILGMVGSVLLIRTVIEGCSIEMEENVGWTTDVV